MSDRKPLMPKATAVWLVENTALSFEQVAVFCGLHVLEVKGIADGDVAQGIQGRDPIIAGQLTAEEIERSVKNPQHELEIAPLKVAITPSSAKRVGANRTCASLPRRRGRSPSSPMRRWPR